jgi:NADPH-dependent 2,4-dienoyl-CoA reductase/sulfur reductase-like enzyme
MNFDVTVIGGGPAGLAAAVAAKKSGAETLLIEREERLGGILKQCIHDGFGLVRFQEKLSGPEYAERFIHEFRAEKIEALTQTFVTKIEKTGGGFQLSAVSRDGVRSISTKTIVFATGCRERTAKQVFIHGTRPAGVFTAGTAQHLINLMGQMPAKKCVVLGSGDIGLIMARRLTLEGAQVLGVYEAKPTPSGLTRNIHQCLHDFGIPLHLSKTVTRVFGRERVTAVEVCSVDEAMRPIEGTEEIVECDALILSVGLIPENELAESLGVEIDPGTKGPVCDETLMTSVCGVFSCGNSLHVNDLVDYVSESGECAGRAAAAYAGGARGQAELTAGKNLLYLVPQRLNLNAESGKTVLYFRSRRVFGKCVLIVKADGTEVFQRKYPYLHPPEMERLEYDFTSLGLGPDARISFDIVEA